VVPAIIGVILGPRAELQLRRALQISNGEISGLFDSPLAITIYLVILVVLCWPLVNRFVLRRGRRPLERVATGPRDTDSDTDGAPPPGAEDRPRVPADGLGDERPPGREEERP
jgi:hypothetical protein